MTHFPPLKIEEARKFSVCRTYKNFQICAYVGGTGDLYWAYIIYTLDGDRCHFNRMDKGTWETEQILKYCEEIIDHWEKPTESVEIIEY